MKLGDKDIFVHILKQAVNQSGLTRTNFTGDHNKAVPVPDRVFHVGLRPAMHLAQIEEIMIRCQLEGLFVKTKILVV